MLSFYLAFLYADRPYYNEFLERILCMSKFLFDVQQKNRLEQKGLLQRFSIICYGHQESVEEMRAHKAEKYKELKLKKDKKNMKEFEEWFLNYKPDENKNKINKSTNDKMNKSTNDKMNDKIKNKKKQNSKTKNISKKNVLDIYGRKTRRNKNALY
jgi:hypothetical protein